MLTGYLRDLKGLAMIIIIDLKTIMNYEFWVETHREEIPLPIILDERMKMES